MPSAASAIIRAMLPAANSRATRLGRVDSILFFVFLDIRAYCSAIYIRLPNNSGDTEDDGESEDVPLGTTGCGGHGGRGLCAEATETDGSCSTHRHPLAGPIGEIQ